MYGYKTNHGGVIHKRLHRLISGAAVICVETEEKEREHMAFRKSSTQGQGV